MICVICKQGETRAGLTTVTLGKGSSVFVVHRVPARVCSNCGEAYVDDGISERLLNAADTAIHTGVQVDIREYKAT